MAWLTPADFDSSSTVSKQEVDEKLDEWEMLGVRVRKEARRLQRQGPTGACSCEIGTRWTIRGFQDSRIPRIPDIVGGSVGCMGG